MGKYFKTSLIREDNSKTLNVLYKSKAGRFLLKGLIQPYVSTVVGICLNSSFSKGLIQPFIKHNKIKIEAYQAIKYTSFNHFFMREIKPESRFVPIEELSLAAPCDGKMTVFPIDKQQIFQVKRSEYTVSELLGSSVLAENWQGGWACIFRLTPADYHHYYFIDQGTIISHKKIRGVFHTVQPIAIHNKPVFSRNSREATIINTKNFGKIAQIEVGALMVGKIKNLKDKGTCFRFEKKGWFEFGGSTVILLFQADAVTIDPEIIKNTENNMETIVEYGQVIGVKKE